MAEVGDPFAVAGNVAPTDSTESPESAQYLMDELAIGVERFIETTLAAEFCQRFGSMDDFRRHLGSFLAYTARLKMAFAGEEEPVSNTLSDENREEVFEPMINAYRALGNKSVVAPETVDASLHEQYTQQWVGERVAIWRFGPEDGEDDTKAPDYLTEQSGETQPRRDITEDVVLTGTIKHISARHHGTITLVDGADQVYSHKAGDNEVAYIPDPKSRERFDKCVIRNLILAEPDELTGAIVYTPNAIITIIDDASGTTHPSYLS